MNFTRRCISAAIVGSAFIFFNCSKDDLPLPECTATVFPSEGQIVPTGVQVTLRWRSSADATQYDVFFGEGGNPVLVSGNVGATELDLEVSQVENTTYSWYVVAKNQDGQHAECSPDASTFVAKKLPPVETTSIQVNVLVLNYDPVVSGTARLHEIFHWNDPEMLAKGYISDVKEASHGLINYNIVEWKDVDEFPAKVDGFRYTYESFSTCISNHANCHTPDELDYSKIFEDHDVAESINNDVYDEVWFFGAPYFGFSESAMAGNGAFYINGSVFPDVDSKAFAVMGFSYERGVAEMLHDLCHRTESTMSHVYGGWQAENLNTSWAKFAANQKQSGVAAVGSCHYPPNANSDYDYCNETPVQSSADDWYNYPYLTGKMKAVNVYTWGPGDCQREYLKWWFHHLPHRSGTSPDGNLNNWWRYIFELP